MTKRAGRHRGSTGPPLSIPPELGEFDTRWDDDGALPPLPTRHLGEARTPLPPLPGSAPPRIVDSTPPDSEGCLMLGDPLGEGSALALVDRLTPDSPLFDLDSLPAPPCSPDLLADTEPPPLGEAETSRQMLECYAAGDFSGALRLAESLIAGSPGHVDAMRHAQSCRNILAQMYASHLGSLSRIARTAVPPERIRWLSLDHRSGFLLSLVDGTLRMEDILDMCGMPRLEALRILSELLQQGVIAVE